jgi:ketosteroid isomerase-like protein
MAANLKNDVAATILAMERAALDRWGKGDPSGYLEICAPDVVYFDPFLEWPLEGLDALTRYYEGLRGKVQIDRDEIIHPIVQVCGEMAVLSFNYASSSGAGQMRWNCTEVYGRKEGRWRIIHTHWSITQHLKN